MVLSTQRTTSGDDPEAVESREDGDVAGRIAAATAARRRRPDYASEVRALLDAARSVIAATGRARVADIVAEAGLSNDAFYRHFPSKDALVAAITEEGTERLAARLTRLMAAEPDPEAQIRCWLDALLTQTDADHAGPTLAGVGVSTNFNTALPIGNHELSRLPIARVLHEPFAALGSTDPVLDAELVTHAVTNRVAGHLWSGTSPSPTEAEHLARFCLATARAGSVDHAGQADRPDRTHQPDEPDQPDRA